MMNKPDAAAIDPQNSLVALMAQNMRQLRHHANESTTDMGGDPNDRRPQRNDAPDIMSAWDIPTPTGTPLSRASLLQIIDEILELTEQGLGEDDESSDPCQ
jgi:hypothetical protein